MTVGNIVAHGLPCDRYELNEGVPHGPPRNRYGLKEGVAHGLPWDPIDSNRP